MLIPEDTVRLRREYCEALNAVISYLTSFEDIKLTKKEIGKSIKEDQSKLTHLLYEKYKRGINEYRATLMKILQVYKDQLDISDISFYIKGTEFEKIVDCKEVVRYIDSIRKSSSSSTLDTGNETLSKIETSKYHFLIYWWYRNTLFSNRLLIERLSEKQAKAELFFYEASGISKSDLKAVEQEYTQRGDSDIYNTSTHVMTVGQGLNSSNFFRTFISLKINRHEWSKLKLGHLVAGTYSTISRRLIDIPVSGLMIGEYVQSKEDAEEKMRLAVLFNSNNLLNTDENYKKLIIIQQLLFRENSNVSKYEKLRSPFKINDLTNPADKKNLSYCSKIAEYSGKYILTFINTQFEDHIVENGILDIQSNGHSTLTLAPLQLRSKDTFYGNFRTISGGNVLLGQFEFSEKFGFSKINFSILTNALSSGKFYGTYNSLGQHSKNPSIGRVRLIKQISHQFKPILDLGFYYPLSELIDRDIDFYNIIYGSRENQKTHTPFGESMYILEKLKKMPASQQNLELNNDKINIVYKEYAGVYELYSIASHTKEGLIQMFPLLIDAQKNIVEIRSRGQSYYGKLQLFKSGILEIYFDKTSEGLPHFMHKLFLVKTRKMVDKKKPIEIYGISNRINRDQNLRASFDILLVSNKKWDSKDFVFEEDALKKPRYKHNAMKVSSIYNNDEYKPNLIVVSYAPDELR